MVTRHAYPHALRKQISDDLNTLLRILHLQLVVAERREKSW